jgi:hypothetical protein
MVHEEVERRHALEGVSLVKSQKNVTNTNQCKGFTSYCG